MKMSLLRILIADLLVLSMTLPAYAAQPTHDAIRQELLQMKARDKESRELGIKGDLSTVLETDAVNQKRLKEIVERYGWPTVEMVGQDGAYAAFILAQHADRDKAFQLRVLSLMEPLLRLGQIPPPTYAYLYDRTHYPQRYGTQGICVSRGEWRPFEIESIEGVDERRRELLMPPLAQYASGLAETCGNTNVQLQRRTDTRRTETISPK